MRILVTRPAVDAHAWVSGLQAAGFDALSLPLIEIGLVADLSPAVLAWHQLESYDALMFVSGYAVAGFFAARPSDIESPFEKFGKRVSGEISHAPRTRATGPGTHQALLEAGVAAQLIDAPAPDSAQFDSEALWERVSGTVRAGMKVLIVRGASKAEGGNPLRGGPPDSVGLQGDGRDWLVTRLQDFGVSVERVAVYQRQSPHFSAPQELAIRSAAQDASIWLFSSSEAVENLTNRFTDLQWSKARAVATHPRIAQTVLQAGFGVVCESRPTLEAVVASIESMG